MGRCIAAVGKGVLGSNERVKRPHQASARGAAVHEGEEGRVGGEAPDSREGMASQGITTTCPGCQGAQTEAQRKRRKKGGR